MIHPLAGIALVLAVLAGMVIFLSHWRKVAQPPPEITRKTLHVGMGLFALFFPALFTSFWPIAVIAALGTCGILALRLAPFQQRAGAILGCRTGCNSGVISFSLGITALNALNFANPHYAHYAIPLLLLAVADALAALIGLQWGRHRYLVPGGSKSFEGSLAFLSASFVCSASVLLIAKEAEVWQAVLMSAVLSLVVTTLESFVAHGIDNFVVPIVAYSLLKVLDGCPIAVLWISLLLAVCLVCCLIRYCFAYVLEAPALKLSSATSDTT